MFPIRSLANDKSVNAFEVFTFFVAKTLYPSANLRLLEHVSFSLAQTYEKISQRQAPVKKHHEIPQQRNVLQLPLRLGSADNSASSTQPRTIPRPEPDRRRLKRAHAESSITSAALDEHESKKRRIQIWGAHGTGLPPKPSAQKGQINTEDATRAALMFKTPSEWRYAVISG